MDDIKEPEWEGKSERYHLVARCGAYALLAGLAIELFLVLEAIDFSSFAKKCASILANSLVTGGVWMEVHFTRVAGKYDDRVKFALSARVAEANSEAARTMLELARITTPRHLNEEQIAAIVRDLEPFKGMALDVGAVSNASEISVFATQLVDVFIRSGLKCERHDSRVANQSRIDAFGVIAHHTNDSEEGRVFATAVARSLSAQGIAAIAAGGFWEWFRTGAPDTQIVRDTLASPGIAIVVGDKI